MSPVNPENRHMPEYRVQRTVTSIEEVLIEADSPLAARVAAESATTHWKEADIDVSPVEVLDKHGNRLLPSASDAALDGMSEQQELGFVMAQLHRLGNKARRALAIEFVALGQRAGRALPPDQHEARMKALVCLDTILHIAGARVFSETPLRLVKPSRHLEGRATPREITDLKRRAEECGNAKVAALCERALHGDVESLHEVNLLAVLLHATDRTSTKT